MIKTLSGDFDLWLLQPIYTLIQRNHPFTLTLEPNQNLLTTHSVENKTLLTPRYFPTPWLYLLFNGCRSW